MLKRSFFFFSFCALGVQDFVLTNPKGAQALGKEFLTSAPWVIQGAIKFSQFNGPEKPVKSFIVQLIDISFLFYH